MTAAENRTRPRQAGSRQPQSRRWDLPRGAVPAAAGIVVIDKPGGLTSHDVVAQVRRLAATRKVGHAGTLDPMATGILVLGIGKATKLLTYLVGAEKEYLATIRLGQSTVTDDSEGEVTASTGVAAAALTPAKLAAAIGQLTGEIRQVPARVSAIKVDGQRAYARVRAGKEVALAARPVNISRFDLLHPPRLLTTRAGIAVCDLSVAVTCSSGTYIRALARDLGEILGTGGHLTSLRRTRVGPFAVGKTLATAAEQVSQDQEATTPTGLETLGINEVCSQVFPRRDLSAAEALDLGYGRALPPSGITGAVAAFAQDGRCIALVADRGEKARPLLVLEPN